MSQKWENDECGTKKEVDGPCGKGHREKKTGQEIKIKKQKTWEKIENDPVQWQSATVDGSMDENNVCKPTWSCKVTGDKAGADVLLSVLFDRGLVGVRAGGDFEPRPELRGGDPAESTDPTPPASSWDTGAASEADFELEGRRPWTCCGCCFNKLVLTEV